MLRGRGISQSAKLPFRAPNGERRGQGGRRSEQTLAAFWALTRCKTAILAPFDSSVSNTAAKVHSTPRAHARTARTSKLYARARISTHARTHACATHEHAHAARAHIYMPHASVLLCICVSEGGSRAGGEETKLRGNCLRTRTRNTLHLCESDWLDAFVSECCSTLALRSFGKGSSASRALSSHVKIRRPATRLYFCS